MRYRKKLRSKIKAIKVPANYITELLSLQFMRIAELYQHRSRVFNLILADNTIYTTHDDCYYGVSIKLDKIKSLDHGLNLLINMGYFPLLNDVGYIKQFYFDKFLVYNNFINEDDCKDYDDLIDKGNSTKDVEAYLRNFINLNFDLFLEEYSSLTEEELYDRTCNINNTVIEKTRQLLKSNGQLYDYVENPEPKYTDLDARLAKQNK